MPPSPERVLFKRRKRNEAVLNSLTKLIGYSALVALVSSIVYVVIEKSVKNAKMEDAYLESVIEESSSEEGGRWSGIKESQPAIMSSLKEKNARQKADAGKTAANDEARPMKAADEAAAKAKDDPRAAMGLPKAGPVSGIANLETKRPLIEEAVRRFFDATVVGQKLAYVRDPSRVRPLMNEYYQRQPMPKVKWESLGWTLPVDEPGYRLGYVQAIFADGPASNLIVEELENGSFVVDWESYVRYGELAWQEFLKLRPSQPKLFRVIASKADTAGNNPETSRLVMIELKHPEEEGSVFATLDKNDPDLAPVVQQLQSGKWKKVPLTLRLCYPGSPDSGKAVRIAGVEGKGWLILQHTRS